MNFFYYGYRTPDPSLIQLLENHTGLVAVDVETPSLEDRRLLGIGFAIGPTDSFYIPMGSPYIPMATQKLLDPTIPKVFHNGHFDLMVIDDSLHTTVANYVDTIIEAQLLGMRPNLADLCSTLLGETKEPISTLIGTGVNTITMDQVPVELVAKRCCEDCQVTYRIHEIIKDQVPQEALTLELQLMPIIMAMEQRGILVDRDKVDSHYKEAKRQMDFYLQVSEGQGCNPGSSKQVAAVLQSRGWQIPYNRHTKKPIMNEEALRTYFLEDPFTHIVLGYRKYQHQVSWFKKLLSEHIKPDGKIHGRFHQAVTDSGRLSSSKPNLQNPEPRVRDIFIPSPGNIARSLDFSQIELRMAAYLSQDPVMLKVFADPLGDIHGETALRLNIQRRRAKDVNFAILYGGDAYTLLIRAGIPLEEGKALIKAHRQGFKGLWSWVDERKSFVKANGYIETLLGRRRYFPLALNGNKWEVEKSLREAINHPIQGSAAEVLKRAMLVWKDLPQVNSLHDETWLDILPDMDIPEEIKVAPFPIPLGKKVGLSWGGMVEYK